MSALLSRPAPFMHDNLHSQHRLGDDTLDVGALQGVPGVVGTMLVGVFAEGVYTSTPGLINGGGFVLLGKQVVMTIVTIVWSFIWTYALMHFMRVTVKVRVDAHVHTDAHTCFPIQISARP